jgi:hypothetical protein
MALCAATVGVVLLAGCGQGRLAEPGQASGSSSVPPAASAPAQPVPSDAIGALVMISLRTDRSESSIVITPANGHKLVSDFSYNDNGYNAQDHVPVGASTKIVIKVTKSGGNVSCRMSASTKTDDADAPTLASAVTSTPGTITCEWTNKG